MVSLLLTAALSVIALAGAASVLYLLTLLLAAAWSRPGRIPPVSVAPEMTLAVVIPAHDEALVLAATLQSLAAQSYPPSLREMIVVADNCTDETAEIAHARGATVLERRDAERRGKGHALDWALARLLALPRPADAVPLSGPMNDPALAVQSPSGRGSASWLFRPQDGATSDGGFIPPEPGSDVQARSADAYVIVDADTWVAPDFLERVAARLSAQADARGYAAVQGRYGVLNADEGWRAALMAAAFDLFNHVKPLGRDRLGLGVGLKGNGMAFTRALLLAAPWRGDSVTEDIDYGLDLARHHGVRVRYAPEAVVRAQMPTTARQAASQRARWEGGRYRLLRERALPLLADGLRRRSALLCDGAVDLLLPPLAELAGLVAAWLLLAGVGAYLHRLPHADFWLMAGGVTALGLGVYVLGGLRVSGASREAYLALLRAPFYAVWKFGLYAVGLRNRRRGPAEWVRTARAPLSPSVTEPESP